MSRVLVTGGTGFIGRQVLPMLVSAGHEVHVVSSREVPDVDGVRWHRADLLEPGEPARIGRLIGAERLLHLAWYAEPGKYWTSPLNFRWVQATLELVQAFTEAGGRRIVAAGTCAEYDWDAGVCVEGATPLRPGTPYGVCKAALSAMLVSYGESVGVEVAWGRVFFLYGPHEHPGRAVPSVVHALLRGEPARCSHGRQVRDFLYVTDVARAFVALVDARMTGAVNIASGEGVTLRQIFQQIAEQLGRADRLLLGALPARPGEPDTLLADVRRLRDELGWTPTVELDEGIRRTIEWCRHQTR